MPRRKVANAYTTGINSVPVTGTKYSPTPPPVNAPPRVTVNGVTVPWSTTPASTPAAPVNRRPVIAFGAILLLLAFGSLVGAWRQATRGDVARYAPPVEAVAVAPPTAEPVPALIVPTPTPVQVYAVAPTMTLYCNGQRVEMTSAKQAAARYAAGCVAAYGWCEACQIAWQAAHP